MTACPGPSCSSLTPRADGPHASGHGAGFPSEAFFPPFGNCPLCAGAGLAVSGLGVGETPPVLLPREGWEPADPGGHCQGGGGALRGGCSDTGGQSR